MGHRGGTGGAVAGDDVDHPRRKVGVLQHLGQQQRGQRRGLRRLQHDGVAGGQGGGQLPGRHQQREVPGDDLAHDAHRPRLGAGEGVVQLVGPAGVVEEVRRRQGQIHVAGLLDGFAAVERLQHGELPGPLLQQPGDAVQVARPHAARRVPPSRLVGLAGRQHPPVDVLGPPDGERRQRLAGGGVHGGRRLLAAGWGHLAADEQPVVVGQTHQVGVLGRRGVGGRAEVRQRGRHPLGDLGAGGGVGPGGGQVVAGVAHRLTPPSCPAAGSRRCPGGPAAAARRSAGWRRRCGTGRGAATATPASRPSPPGTARTAWPCGCRRPP